MIGLTQRLAIGLAPLLLLPHAAAARSPDWQAVADVDVVRAITRDADGSERETRIWLVVVDGQGFVRTGSSRWGDDLERDPNLVLRIEEQEYPLRADPIEDEAFRTRIEQAFRDKYGWSDAFIGVFRRGESKIMHMAPR